MKDRNLSWRKHMIFSSNEELFACPLFQVKEVVGLLKMTAVPNAPQALKGLINLRGKVLPIFDLSEKIRGQSSGYENKKPCILIAESDGASLGLLVDDVVEVLSLEDGQIEKSDKGDSRSSNPIEGVVNIEGRPLILLMSIENLFKNEEIPRYRKDAA